MTTQVQPTTPARRLAWFDLTFAAGCCAIAVGVGLWSVPLAVVIAGALLVVVSLLAARREQHASSSAPPTNTTRSDDARIADSAAA